MSRNTCVLISILCLPAALIVHCNPEYVMALSVVCGAALIASRIR